MNKEEIIKLIKILKISYPSYFRELQDDEIVLMTQLWERKFKNYSLDQVSNAIDNLTSKSKFMPSISEVLSEIIQMSTPQLNPYSEWENVLKAVRKYGTYNQDKALASLDEPTSTIARQLGWYRICTTERIEFEKNKFMEMFEYYNDKEEECLLTNTHQTTLEQLKQLAKKEDNGLLRRIRKRIKERIGMKKIFDYIQLLAKYNTLKNHCEMIENNFKNSAYKNVLAYEQQKQMIEDLEEQLKIANELNLEIKKARRNKATVQRLKKGDIEK